MKKLQLSILGIFFFGCAVAQSDLGTPVFVGMGGVASTIATDYEAIGINPANLGFEYNKKIAVGLLNVGVNIQSKAFNLKEMYNAFTKPDAVFTTEQKNLFASVFTSENGLNFQSHINWLAGYVAIGPNHGIGLNVRERSYGHVSANENLADIIFNGYNAQAFLDTSIYSQYVSDVFDGSRANFIHYRELNLDYGMRLLNINDGGIKLYAGAGAKYLWGMSFVDIKAEGNTLYARAAIEQSSFDVNNGFVDNFYVDDHPPIFNCSGHGFAFDLGLSLAINDKIKIGASATDIGSITWDNNVVEGTNTLMPHLDTTQTGLNSFEIKDNVGFLFDPEGLIDFQPGAAFTTSLPSKFRLGAGYRMTEFIEFGADMTMPLNDVNGNLDAAFFSLGGKVNVFETWKVSSGISGNATYGFNIPLGISTGKMGILEIYVATSDILSYFSKSRNPMLSFAFGIIRISIEKPELVKPPVVN
ncbi:MAG: DUF5723 family protein [Bacteroidota bacterium]